MPKKKKTPKPGQNVKVEKSAARAVHLSTENEARVRQLLDNVTAQQEEQPDAPVHGSRKTAEEKLHDIYGGLERMGFKQAQIEAVLRALPGVRSQEAALDWLCLNTPPEELPQKFAAHSTSRSSQKGTVRVIASVRNTSSRNPDELPTGSEAPSSVPATASVPRRSDQEKCEEQARASELERQKEKDWIRQYMEAQSSSSDEEEAEGSKEEIDDWELWGDPREIERRKSERAKQAQRAQMSSSERAKLVLRELGEARGAASEAKAAGNKAKQQQFGLLIRDLLAEMKQLGD
ncbi:hypothetical protein CYMTET_27791 [Cymbomonas tetramitiformis]|uniref:ATP-dependent RNA helicase DHX29-like UBA domain-containing protein n=1 Tax=Cymbomonas tetramitiformis TaxID=36881 RepID=A0AAE0FPM6_9CHLO|nr:hypothetical protein CYMTET_27791 [Cymbomonas tetramitiformis]